jgi:hypothetical protein
VARILGVWPAKHVALTPRSPRETTPRKVRRSVFDTSIAIPLALLKVHETVDLERNLSIISEM